jgi:hypothetical protein
MTSMTRAIAIASVAFAAASTLAAAQPAVHVEPSNLQGPRALEDQTRTAAIRDYLQSWQGLEAAFNQNRVDLLDRDFVGAAHDKLSDTIQQQTKLGIRTSYTDRVHDLQVVFYSPDGLSIELTDKVDYDLQVFDHDKPQGTAQVSARYVVVMTPAEAGWKVRVLQAEIQ